MLGNFFGKLDPTKLILGGLSLFGGDDPFQKRSSFEGTGADPVKNMSASLAAIKNLAAQLGNQQPREIPQLLPNSPKPISVPGLPFQIGGGLGVDPAVMSGMKFTNPFDSASNPSAPQSASPVTRRKPNASSSQSI